MSLERDLEKLIAKKLRIDSAVVKVEITLTVRPELPKVVEPLELPSNLEDWRADDVEKLLG
jgi:hypothetical protein